MSVEHLNPDLRELNRMIGQAFIEADALTDHEQRACRWRVNGIPTPECEFSPAQEEFAARLEGVFRYASDRGFDRQVAAWCLAAAGEGGAFLEGRNPTKSSVRPSIADFLLHNVPSPATVLDVASASGYFSRPLAGKGYSVSLLDPALPFLEAGLSLAKTEGISDRICAAMCGTFADLEKLGPNSYDVCMCMGALLYAHPRARADEAFRHLARIASKAVIVEFESKFGVILRIGEDFDASEEAVRQILATGTTPPAKPEHAGEINSCYSSREIRDIAGELGLDVHDIIGIGIAETLTRTGSTDVPANEMLGIEELLRQEPELLDSFPNLLALCTTRSGSGSPSK